MSKFNFKTGKIIRFKTILTEDDLKKRKENKSYCPYYYQDDVGIILELVEDGDKKWHYAKVLKRDGTIDKIYYDSFDCSSTRIDEKLRKSFESYYICYKEMKKLEAKHNEIKEKLNKEMSKMNVSLEKEISSLKKSTKIISRKEFVEIVCNKVKKQFGESVDYDVHPCLTAKKLTSSGVKEVISFEVYLTADVDRWPNPEKFSFLYREYDNTIHFASNYKENEEYKEIINDFNCRHRYKMNIFNEPDGKITDLSLGDKYIYCTLSNYYNFELDEFSETTAEEVVQRICCKDNNGKQKAKKVTMNVSEFCSTVCENIEEQLKEFPENKSLVWSAVNLYKKTVNKENCITIRAYFRNIVDEHPSPKVYSFLTDRGSTLRVKSNPDKLEEYKAAIKRNSRINDKVFKIISKPTEIKRRLVIVENQLVYEANAYFEIIVPDLSEKSIKKCMKKIIK